MSALLETMRSLSGGQSGHWGIVSERSEAYAEDDQTFAKLKNDRSAVLVHFRCNGGGRITDVNSGRSLELSDLQQRLNDLRTTTKAEDHRIARCLFSDFDKLSIDDQCLVLRMTRAAREETNDLKLQTIIVGTWNLFRIQAHWKQHYDDISPVPDRKHVFVESRATAEDIIAKLRVAELVSNPPNNFGKVCASMLEEVTGGDVFIVDYIIGCLTAQCQRLEVVESVISQSIESGELTEEIRRRCSRLAEPARVLLRGVLCNQFVSRSDRDPDTEDLRLSGLISIRATGGQNICLSVRSPIVEAILREKWALLVPGQPSVYNGRDLARPNIALNTAAYRLVSEIENALRNLIVLSLSSGSRWTERIVGVKTLAHDGGAIGNDLLKLAREIQNVLLPYSGSIEPALTKPRDEISPLQDSKKPKQITLVEAAEDWRARNRSDTLLELGDDSLIYFLTTEGLASVLVNEKQGIYPNAVKRFFPNKHELATFLEHYVAIRAAVAHNQPISLVTLKRLEAMREDLEKRIYRSQPNAT